MRGLQKRRKGLASSWKWTGKRLRGATHHKGQNATLHPGDLIKQVRLLSEWYLRVRKSH